MLASCVPEWLWSRLMTVCLRVCPDRTAQYACTLLGYTLQKSGASTELRKTVSHLEAHMSLTRKCECCSPVPFFLFFFFLTTISEVSVIDIHDCVAQWCVWETQWRRLKLPKGPSTCPTAYWGSVWPSATWTKPCTLPVTMSSGLGRRASSPNWINTNGVRGLLGKKTFHNRLSFRVF